MRCLVKHVCEKSLHSGSCFFFFFAWDLNFSYLEMGQTRFFMEKKKIGNVSPACSQILVKVVIRKIKVFIFLT